MKKRCIFFIRNLIIAVFCTFTAFSHCLFGYASNDDEFITFNNYETIQAYNYFSLYGLTANLNSSYNSSYTTTGSISGSASFSITGTDGLSFNGVSEDELHGGLMLNPIDDGYFNLDVNSQIMIGQLRQNDDTASTLRLSCTYTYDGQQPPGPATAVCTDPNFIDTTRYNVYLYPAAEGITLEGRPSTQFAHFVDAEEGALSDTASVVWTEGTSSFSGSLSLHENGSLSGNGTVSLVTTTVDVIHLKYVMPLMTGTVNNPDQTTNVNSKLRYRIYKDNPFVIAYFVVNELSGGFQISINNQQADSIESTVMYNRITPQYRGGYVLKLYESKTDLDNSYYNNYYYNLFNDRMFSQGIIPLYVGHKNFMSDSTYRFLYGSDRIIETIEKQTNIIENGNPNSQQKEQVLNTQTIQMQNQMNQFQTIEDAAGDNMNTALNNINTNPSLLSTNKFLVSVDWIRQQYNRIVTNTPFEAVITFCLVFGLGLLLLGKVR